MNTNVLIASIFVNEYPDARDEDVAREVIDCPDLRRRDWLGAVKIRGCGLELRWRRRTIDIDIVAAFRQIRRTDRAACISSIGRRVLETLDGRHGLEKSQAMGQHLVGYVRSTLGDDGYRCRSRERAARNIHREVGARER